MAPAIEGQIDVITGFQHLPLLGWFSHFDAMHGSFDRSRIANITQRCSTKSAISAIARRPSPRRRKMATFSPRDTSSRVRFKSIQPVTPVARIMDSATSKRTPVHGKALAMMDCNGLGQHPDHPILLMDPGCVDQFVVGLCETTND